MCSIAIAAVAATAAAGIAQAGSTIQASKAQQAQANYAAGVAQNNATIAEMQAKDATERGSEAERNERLRTQKLMGDQRAAFAANNVLLDTGTASEFLSDTAALGELDALAVRRNAAREAFGFRAQKTNFLAEAQMNKMRAKQAKKALPLQVAGDLLGSTSQILGQAHSYQGSWNP